MIVALAGRRIDDPNEQPPRFPLDNADLVRDRILRELQETSATALVCSAACGADLLAIDAADQLNLPCRIVLPFGPMEFREASVVDRPGPWGELFDRAVARARGSGRLEILRLEAKDPATYLAVNDSILMRARELAHAFNDRVLAMVVWDGQRRNESDVTLHFRQTAEQSGVPVKDISTTQAQSVTSVDQAW